MLSKSFEPNAIEETCYRTWEQAGYFAPQGEGKPFCIVIPPPNVTGSLHMGHAFQQTLMDVLTRYQRMKGRKTLWLVGTDHAGIATQMVVERQLNAQGQSRHQLGRDAFVEAIWRWKETSGCQITQQLRRLGASVDWSRERFTLDAEFSNSVNQAFVALYEAGFIYRGQRLVNWDPILKTAVSDLEVEQTEESGHLWHIRYPLSQGDALTVATTRPETLFGDVALAVHPDDTRYQHLIGQTARVPISHREIPIIADAFVDPNFGSGVVKITPAHDFNDYAVGQAHQLPCLNILNDDASLNTAVPEAYQGLDRFIARERLIADLETQGLLLKTEAHLVRLPRGDRTQAILEPWLTDQWFVRMTELSEPALSAVKHQAAQFIPEQWTKTYNEWLNNIQDWCISRQLWWGHRIPAWFDETGRIFVGLTEDAVRARHNLGSDTRLHQEEAVLDTWFSSALWPFAALGWPHDTQDLKTFYPTQVLVTGFDIIFFWVARMLILSLKFTDRVPFKEIYIHGLIQDHLGQKMSKSKGNVLDPIDLIDGISLDALLAKRTHGLMQPKMREGITAATKKQFPKGIEAFGCDALRFTFCALATQNRHIRFDLKRIEGYRHFANKLWNAARFVLLRTEDYVRPKQYQPSLACRWIRTIWQTAKKDSERHLNQYRFDLFASTLYEFIWNEYCDWYLEFAKPLLADERSKPSAQTTLLEILVEVLQALHPAMPFITEQLWQAVRPKLGASGPTIMYAPFPEAEETDIDNQAMSDMTLIKDIVISLRNLKGEMQLSPVLALPILIQNAKPAERAHIEQHRHFMQALVKIESLDFIELGSEPKQAALALADHLKIWVPLAGLIDNEREQQRLLKEQQKASLEASRIKARLSETSYLTKAPAQVVANERTKLAALERKLSELALQLHNLS